MIDRDGEKTHLYHFFIFTLKDINHYLIKDLRMLKLFFNTFLVMSFLFTGAQASTQANSQGCPAQLDLRTYLTIKFQGALMVAGKVEGTSVSFSSLQDSNLAHSRTQLEEALLNHFNHEKSFKLLQEKDGVCDYGDEVPDPKTHVSYLLKK